MAKHFSLDCKCLWERLERDDQVREKKVGARKKRRKLYKGGKNFFMELDKVVLNFMLEEQTNGWPVFNKDLHMNAHQCAKELNLADSFKASPIWLKCWKHRKKGSLRCGTIDAPENYHYHSARWVTYIPRCDAE